MTQAPLAVLALAGAAGPAGMADAAVPPDRLALQSRIDAVRAALAAQGAPSEAAPSPATWLVAQANNWTNWPKWSKWSNWANK